MSVKNLLKESILQAKKIKQVSTLSTKDKLVANISQSLKRKLNQNEDFENDEEIDVELEDVLNDQDSLQENEDYNIEEQDIDIEIEDDELPLGDEEYSEILDQLEQQDEQAYTEDALTEDQDIDIEIEDQDIKDQDIEEQELMQKIKSILQSDQEQEQQISDEQMFADDQEQQIIQRLKTQNRKLRKQNAEYSKAIKSINKELNESKCIQLKGKYAINIFEKYNLSRNQKIKIVQNFDRAKNEREIKLIYATLMEGLKKDSTHNIKGLASSKMNSTKTKIKENRDHTSNVDTAIANIFAKRAGING